MPLTHTYTSLKDDLQSWLEDDDADFTASLDAIIALGELKLLRDLDLEIFEDTDALTLTSGQNEVTKPADILAPRTLTYTNGAGDLAYLHPRTYEYVKDYGGSGDPLYYAELSETKWLIAPTPNANRSGTVRFIKRPTGLSSGTATTWLSTHVADALFYACLVCAEEYVKADERIPVWKGKYDNELLPAAKMEARKLIRAEYR